MSHFTAEQDKLVRRIQTVRDLITDTNLHHKPCPLLKSQLVEMQVLSERLLGSVNLLLQDPRIGEMD